MKKLKEKAITKEQREFSYYHLYNNSQQYDEIIHTAFTENTRAGSGKKERPKKGKVMALIGRFKKYKSEVCSFIKEFKIEFDNNQAERNLRMMKIKTKVSGCL